MLLSAGLPLAHAPIIGRCSMLWSVAFYTWFDCRASIGMLAAPDVAWQPRQHLGPRFGARKSCNQWVNYCEMKPKMAAASDYFPNRRVKQHERKFAAASVKSVPEGAEYADLAAAPSFPQKVRGSSAAHQSGHLVCLKTWSAHRLKGALQEAGTIAAEGAFRKQKKHASRVSTCVCRPRFACSHAGS